MLLLAVAHHHRVALHNDDTATAIASISLLFFGLIGLAFWGAIALVIYRALVISPVTAVREHVQALAARFANPADAVLFERTYAAKQPKSVLTAWLLTFFLSPTISYIYQNKWGLAVIAFLTLQGFGIWWLISWFTMPGEVARYNQLLADQAFNEIMMVRPLAYRQPPSTAPAASENPSSLRP